MTSFCCFTDAVVFQYLLIFAVTTTLSYINTDIQSRLFIRYTSRLSLPDFFALLSVIPNTYPDFPPDPTLRSFLPYFLYTFLTFTLLFPLILPLPCFTPHYFYLLS